MKQSPLAAALALSFCAFAAHAQKPADPDSGIVYETVTTTKMEGLPFNSLERTRTIETSRGMRVDVLERTGAGVQASTGTPMTGGAGTYRLTLYEGTRVISVDTVKREYSEMDFRKMDNLFSEMTKMLSSMDMKMSGMKAEATDLGDGGIILGHPTSHWKLHQTMTTSMAAQGDTMALSTDMFIDTWFANDIARLAPKGPMNSGELEPDSLALRMAHGIFGEDMEKSLEAYKKMPKTLPLKTVTSGSVEMGPMDVIMTTTLEVTKFERGKFDAALFQVPKGYKLVDFPGLKPPSTSQSRDKQF